MNDPVLLLPGFMCDHRLFTQQVTQLQLSRPVFVPAMTGADNLADMAAHILRDAPQSFALAGLSMGGILAMEMMRQAPSRVTRLALLDTNPLAETEVGKVRRIRQIAGAKRGGMDAIIADEMKPLYLSDSAKTESILALCMTMARDLGSSVFIDQSRALLERIDQCDTLRAISVPCLILCGADDKLCPVEKHQMMAELISGARLRIIDKAGHLPPLEAPHLVTEALTDWLGAC